MSSIQLRRITKDLVIIEGPHDLVTRKRILDTGFRVKIVYKIHLIAIPEAQEVLFSGRYGHGLVSWLSPQKVLLAELIDPKISRFKQELKLSRYSPRTQNAYLSTVSKCVENLEKPMEEISRNEIRSYMTSRIDEGLSESWHSQTLAAFRFFYRRVLGSRQVDGLP